MVITINKTIQRHFLFLEKHLSPILKIHLLLSFGPGVMLQSSDSFFSQASCFLHKLQNGLPFLEHSVSLPPFMCRSIFDGLQGLLSSHG